MVRSQTALGGLSSPGLLRLPDVAAAHEYALSTSLVQTFEGMYQIYEALVPLLASMGIVKKILWGKYDDQD